MLIEHYTQYTLFLGAHVILILDHMLGHKIKLKYKKVEIIQSIFFSHSNIKLEINNKSSWFGKSPKYFKIKPYTLNNLCIKEA